MPDPTGSQANPAMVAALSQTEEAVMTKDGIRALTPEEQAGNSPAASVEGAPADTPAPGPETAPVAPAPAPAAPVAPNTLATATPSQARVIDAAGTAIPTGPPAAPAAPSVAAAAPAAPATPAEDEGVVKLAAFVAETETKADAAVEEARRIAQGVTDRQTAAINKQLATATAATAEVKAKMHALEVRDLSPEEKAKAITAFEQADERQELDAIRAELVTTHSALIMDSLTMEFGAFGVTREAIEASGDTPEAMELYCEQQKSEFLQAKLDAPAAAPTVVVGPAPTATVVATPGPVAPASAAPAAAPVPVPVAAQVPAVPAAPAAANAPGVPPVAVPAGAEAPSDIGSTGAAVEAWKPNEEAGAAAMQENIKHTPWEAIQLPN